MSIRFRESTRCPYFDDGRIATFEYVVPDKRDISSFHIYLSRGYRRFGKVFYKNVCERCNECIPIRIEVERFHLSKSQRRTVNKNRDVRVQILNETFVSDEKILLYHKYVNSKHGEKGPESITQSMDTVYHIHYGYPHTIEMNYYIGNKLIGVGIVDVGDDAISSNYFYYDTQYLNRRPGVFSIIQEINLARNMNKRYYYLGYYIKDNQKMSYKSEFRPNQVLIKGKWVDFRNE